MARLKTNAATTALVALVLLAGSCGYPEPARVDGGSGVAGSGVGTAGTSGGAAGKGGSASGGAGGSIGGVGGTGGSATGSAGVSGSAGATAGASGRGGAGTAGTGGGAAGTTGGSAAGSAGVSGSAGASGRGGAGTAGTGGSAAGTTGGSAAGRGGSSAGTGGSGTGGTGGGGATCGASAQCVSVGTGVVGVLTSATGTCPSGFGTTETLLYQNPDGGQQCTGCSCMGTITCTATVYNYLPTSMCMTDTGMVGGTVATTLDDVGGKCAKLSSNSANRITGYTGATGCTKSGTTSLPSIVWGSRTKFCAVNSSYPSCTGGACLPTTTAQPLCILLDGTATCPAAYPAYQGTSLWYPSFTDNRSCGACSCNLQGSGDCTNVSLYYSSISCTAGDPQPVPVKLCTQMDPANIYTVGKGTPPTCSTGSAVSGSVTVNAGKTLCCAN